MHLDERKILNISRELWSTQLGLDLSRAAEAGADWTTPGLSTCIRVSGEWEGTVLLECPESVARHAAGEEIAPEDAQDALGELAEMIAARIQPLLPAESTLSRPVPPNGQVLIGMRGVSELRLVCEGHPVRIAVYESEKQPASAA
jgi:hypothetical protein